MAPGVHVLTFVAYVTPEHVDSAPSAPLTLIVSSPLDVPTARDSGDHVPAASPADVIDCAVAPLGNGTAVAALPTGELHLVDTRRSHSTALEWVMPEGAWQLRAVAAHPDFARTRSLFVLLSDRSDDFKLAVVRYRELEGVLGERAVLATFSRPAETQRPRLRFGPDGELYVALLGEATQRSAAGVTSSSSDADRFLIRVNDERTGPADRADNPTAFDWDPVSSDLWIIEQPAGTAPRARAAQRSDAVVEFSSTESTAVGVGLVRTADAPSITQVWAFMSDGVARQLDGRGGNASVREYMEGERHRVHDALLTSDGNVLSCASRFSEPRTYFVQSARWREMTMLKRSGANPHSK